jgi:enoyl-CoA hydratase/carnithine racemase
MPEVTVERSGATSVVLINRPEARNALTRSVIHDLRGALAAASDDPAIRVVVLTGAGGHFCAGADLRKTIMDDPEMLDHIEIYMDDFHSVVRALVRCSKPTVAMLDGAAVGFGADLAFACDLRIASDVAYVQEKFVKIGLMPDGGGTFWLPRLLGTARAMQAILLADKIESSEMLDLGLLVRRVPQAELRDATFALARELEKGPPLAFAAIKRALYANWGDFDAALDRERNGQIALLRSADAMEGVLAWAQKRDPNFTGK